MSNMKPGARLIWWMLPHQQKGDYTGGTYRLGNITLILEYDENDAGGEFVDIKSITAAQPGTGEGYQVMRLICGMADIFGVHLALYARAHDGKPHNTKRAVRFYERLGFDIHQDQGLDWDADPDEVDEDHAGVDMWRQPDGYRR